MKKLLACYAFVLIQSVSHSQDAFVNNNQSFVSLNPSFAGTNNFIRNQFSYRNEWHSSGTYIYFVNTLDKYIKSIKAGIAITAAYESYANGLTTNGGLGLAYAPHIGLKDGRMKFIPSVQAFYKQWVRDYTKLGPGVNLLFVTNSNEPPPTQEKKSYIDLNAGLLYTLDDKLFLGISANHLGSPIIAMRNHDYQVWARYSFYGSYNFIMSESSVLQVIFIRTKQEKSSSSRIGANMVLWNHLMAGASWLSTNAIVLNAGYRADTFSFLLGYDTSYDRNSRNTVGSWEFHATYNLRNKEKRYTLTSFETM
jgi:type IX secretion system PorP/SprF family membrane protein